VNRAVFFPLSITFYCQLYLGVEHNKTASSIENNRHWKYQTKMQAHHPTGSRKEFILITGQCSWLANFTDFLHNFDFAV